MFKASDVEIKLKANRLYVMQPGMEMGVAEITDGKLTIETWLESLRKIHHIKKLARAAKRDGLGSGSAAMVELLMEIGDL